MPNWKQILWLVVFAAISVILRRSEAITSGWIWWILAIVFVAIYEVLGTKESQDNNDEDIETT